MPADTHQIEEIRLEVQKLLTNCDNYLSSENKEVRLDVSVERLRGLYLRLDLGALEHLSLSLVDTIRQHAALGNQALVGAISFLGAKVQAIRPDRSVDIDKAYDDAFTHIMVACCFGFSPEVINDMQKNARDALAKMNKTMQDTNAVLENAREAAAVEGVSQHARVFHNEANRCQIIAFGWLGMAAMLLFVFVVTGYELFGNSSPDTNIWFLVVTRGVMFSAIVYAVFFCVKNYMVNQHNYVVNKHRQNALQTYQALVGAGASPGVRDIVLTHAARCIFEQRDTGYAKGSGNNEGGNVVNFSPVKAARGAAKLADGD